MRHSSRLRIGGVVLCGGRSTRMGSPKATLPFGDGTMLDRVVRILQTVVSPVVVVAAHGEEPPNLLSEVSIVHDEYESRGPLEGLAAGLAALIETSDAAFVSSCDVPFLRAKFVRRVIERLGDRELAVPRDDRFHHPLAAVYRTSLLPRIRQRLEQSRPRLQDLIADSCAEIIDTEELRDVDPQLDSLRNINTPEEYAAALRSLKKHS